MHHYTKVSPGTYIVKLRQRFKSKGCQTYLTLSLKAQSSTSQQASLRKSGFGSLDLFQSQSEEQERPRQAHRLPMDLESYKFAGGHYWSHGDSSNYHTLFSGPVQVSEIDTENLISFQVKKNNTQVRAYAEQAGVRMVLLRSDQKSSTPIDGASSGSGIYHMLNEGKYRVQINLGSAQAKKIAKISPPRIQVTIMLAEPEAAE